MVEKVLITQKVLTFEGIFNLKDIHLHIRKGFLSKNYELTSHQHELIHNEGRNQVISYTFTKDVLDYEKFIIKVDIAASNIVSQTVTDGDMLRELVKGNLKITFTGRIHSTKEGFVGFRFFESFYRQVYNRVLTTKPPQSAELSGDILAIYDDLYLLVHNLVYEPYTTKNSSTK
jgi:hypothetical protein